MKEIIDPYKLSLSEYDGLVRVCCLNWRNELIKLLIGEGAASYLGKNDAVIVVGSDGKQERHPQSKTEIVVILESGLESQRLAVVNSLSLPPEILCEEIKSLNGSLLSYFKN